MAFFKDLIDNTKETTKNIKKDFDHNAKIRRKQKEIENNLDDIATHKKLIGDIVCRSIGITENEILNLTHNELEEKISQSMSKNPNFKFEKVILAVFEGQKTDYRLRAELSILKAQTKEKYDNQDFSNKKDENEDLREKYKENIWKVTKDGTVSTKTEKDDTSQFISEEK